FDIATYKTVRSGKYPSHPFPNVLSVHVRGKDKSDLSLEEAEKGVLADTNYSEPLSITNSFGVPSYDPEFWQADIRKVLQNMRPGQILIGAFQRTKKDLPDGRLEERIGEYIKDFVITARLMKETGVKVMEVNFSCPNEGT